ncbi:uncharacterized protein [Ambystoma mexicanum]|uniref:uncharacterized protein n=1 Tax=Ambystoma mexicanum TaxID=8296 RepID=UPI0037E9AF99
MGVFTKKMSRKPELQKLHLVKLQEKYWLDSTSEEKVLGLGGSCTGKVIDQEDYFDTRTFELASRQMWLSQKNNAWRLIIGPATHKATPSTKALESNKGTHLEHGNATHREKKGTSLNGSTNGSSAKKVLEKERLHHHQRSAQSAQQFNEERPSEEPAVADMKEAPACTYRELSNEQEIMAYLAPVLRTALTPADASSTDMKEFSQLAGIQHYASFHTTREATYTLLGTYTITIRADEASSRKVAVISLDADVMDIAGGFDGIEKLANELDFQHLPA